MSALEQLRSRLGERYHIERELGRGGMGAVYLARDLRLDRPVALKVLPSEVAVLPSLRERFLRETRTAAGFSHPNIVPVYAVEETEDLLAYAMGFIEGESLAERVGRSGPLGVRETVKLLQDVAYALVEQQGVRHVSQHGGEQRLVHARGEPIGLHDAAGERKEHVLANERKGRADALVVHGAPIVMRIERRAVIDQPRAGGSPTFMPWLARSTS